MCGISGIIGEGLSEDEVRPMVNVQHHRGPDESGIYLAPNRRAVLGHNRLRILDLSPAGRQPMCGPDGRSWIVFNGEVYNYRELRDELGDYRFHTATDTEVILAAYHRWGERCVEHFVGMFAFAIWNERDDSLFCARDRLGVKPFLYARHDGKFYFASEAKAILAAGVPLVPNLRAWADYLVHSYSDHGDEVFIEGIFSLPPAHTMTVRNGQTLLKCYWNLPELTADIRPQPLDEAADEYLHLLEQSVLLRLRSDVKVGINLSGGLDSAGLMLTVDKLAVEQSEIETFTSCYDDRRYDETEFADEVPHRARWVRHRNRMGPDIAWNAVDEVVWHQEGPFGGISTISHDRLFDLAKQHGVTVLLEGQGVDETLAGYAYFLRPFYRDLLAAGRDSEMKAQAIAFGDNPLREEALARSTTADSDANVYQDGTKHLRPECISPEIRRMAQQVPTFARPFSDHLRNALYRDLRYTKLPRVLRMHDRLSMAFGRELRVPYLDHRLIEFTFRLPAEARLDAGRNKVILRHALRNRLKDEIRLSPKRMVVNPQREWFRGPLHDRIRELIDDDSCPSGKLFDGAAMRRAFDEFCAGTGDNSFFIWQRINVAAWFRGFADRVGTVETKSGAGASAVVRSTSQPAE